MLSKKVIMDLADISLLLLLEKDAVIRECSMMTLCLGFLSCRDLSEIEVKRNSKNLYFCWNRLLSNCCSLHDAISSSSSQAPTRSSLLVDLYVKDVFATLVKEKRPDALIGTCKD
jgi:hypothetical protein